MFRINLKKAYWIDNRADNQDDLCLHGDVVIAIGDQRFESSCTVSAAALYLLKSLYKNHNIHEESNQMLPCCGHLIVPNHANDEVKIYGCPNGTDLSVLHENGQIKIVTEHGTNTIVHRDDYRKAVFDFADAVKSFYSCSVPRQMPEQEFERNSYFAFWNEWNRLRANQQD